MASVVTLLAATTFIQSILLVIISASATGVFGLLIVLIQTRADRNLHRRLDAMETKAKDALTQAKDEVIATTGAGGNGE